VSTVTPASIILENSKETKTINDFREIESPSLEFQNSLSELFEIRKVSNIAN
jgi:hypothetical protein